MNWPLVVLWLAVADGGDPSDLKARADLPARMVQRGAALATRQCGGCHAVGPAGPSPRPGAPAFRDLAGRDTYVGLQHTLTEINESGHFAMPPLQPHADQVEAIAAYIESLRR